MKENPYVDRVNLIVDDLVNKKLKSEYFYRKAHENTLKDIPDKLKNIERAFQTAFENYPWEWDFSFRELNRNNCLTEGRRYEGGSFCHTICHLRLVNESLPYNVNIFVLEGVDFNLTIADYEGREDIKSMHEEKFLFKELKDSLEPLGHYLKSVLIRAKERCKE